MAEAAGEYDILGYRVKLKPNAMDDVEPSRCVNLVLDEVAKIKSQSNVPTNEAVLLTALKLAVEKIRLEEGMKKDMGQLQSCAVDALDLIERAIPS
ncbi:MAG: hypothetical protein OXB88_00720 [Bacteriovoracales bacterium]|nr:hypothetical protein [Bacteriovoracales bacterium]